MKFFCTEPWISRKNCLQSSQARMVIRMHRSLEGLVRDDGAESVTGRIRNVCDCDADDCGLSLCPRTKMAKWLCSQRAIGIRGFGLSALGSTARRRGATWRARSQ